MKFYLKFTGAKARHSKQNLGLQTPDSKNQTNVTMCWSHHSFATEKKEVDEKL